VAGVGHVVVSDGDPPQSDPLVWRVDGASRGLNAPDGVIDTFQISADSVEPIDASLSANLFAHDDPRPALADESK
jgi:hypothetical protein